MKTLPLLQFEITEKMAFRKAKEIDDKFIGNFMKKYAKRYKIKSCPACGADLPPSHKLRK